MEEEKLESFSARKLKSILKENFQNSGAINVLKAKLKTEFIKEISKQTNNFVSPEFDLQKRVGLSCIFHFLKRQQLYNTISVFMSECNLENSQTILKEHEIFQILRNDVVSSKPDPCNSVFDHIIAYCLNGSKLELRESATQTLLCGQKTLEILSFQLDDINSAHSKSKAVSVPSSKSVEEIFLEFRRELESRNGQEFDNQMKHFKEHEIQKILSEEKQKSKVKQDKLLQELECDYQKSLQHFVEREKDYLQKLSEQENRFERNLYEQRSLFQKQLEEIKSSESSLLRKYELESQGLKIFELKLKEFESKLFVKSNELEEREKKTDVKYSNCRDLAKQEILSEFASERELLKSERADFLVEKRKFADEQCKRRDNSDSVDALKSSLKSARNELNELESQCEELRNENDNFRKQNKTDRFNELDVSTGERVLELIKINAELQAKLNLYNDSKSVVEDVEKTKKDCSSITVQFDNLKRKCEEHKFQSERLNSENLALRTKARSLEYQLRELKQLLQDKNRNLMLIENERLNSSRSDPRYSFRSARFLGSRNNLNPTSDETYYFARQTVPKVCGNESDRRVTLGKSSSKSPEPPTQHLLQGERPSTAAVPIEVLLHPNEILPAHPCTNVEKVYDESKPSTNYVDARITEDQRKGVVQDHGKTASTSKVKVLEREKAVKYSADRLFDFDEVINDTEQVLSSGHPFLNTNRAIEATVQNKDQKVILEQYELELPVLLDINEKELLQSSKEKELKITKELQMLKESQEQVKQEAKEEELRTHEDVGRERKEKELRMLISEEELKMRQEAEAKELRETQIARETELRMLQEAKEKEDEQTRRMKDELELQEARAKILARKKLQRNPLRSEHLDNDPVDIIRNSGPSFDEAKRKTGEQTQPENIKNAFIDVKPAVGDETVSKQTGNQGRPRFDFSEVNELLFSVMYISHNHNSRRIRTTSLSMSGKMKKVKLRAGN
jgi:hypothetical protein